ncbi:MAG: phosphopantetheine-binding protein [Bacteroidia bacterium]|nr:phosphopantetheine-binding protein [Bacteroidia bacterium]
MEIAEITEKLRSIVRPYVDDKSLLENINGDTDLLKDLKINSAHLVDIILDAEEVFNIEIDDEAAEKMLTVKEAVRIIAERVNAKT